MYPHRIKNAVIYKNKKVNLEIMKKKGGQKSYKILYFKLRNTKYLEKMARGFMNLVE